MAGRVRRRGGNGLDAWPGYVDALSTLLMVIIFVLLVFVLAQAFLSVALTGRSKALDKATADLAALTNALSLEQSKSASLQLSVSQLNQQLERTHGGPRQAQPTLTAANATIQSLTAASAKLPGQLKDVTARADTRHDPASDDRQQLAETSTRADTSAADLKAAQQQLADMKQQIAQLDRTVATDKDTLQAKLSDLAKLVEETRALTALRDQLESQAQDAAANAMTEAAAPRRRRIAALRREEAGRQRQGADRAAEPADRPVQGAAFGDRQDAGADAGARTRRRTSRSPISARS